jgi:hypothetical protein
MTSLFHFRLTHVAIVLAIATAWFTLGRGH